MYRQYTFPLLFAISSALLASHAYAQRDLKNIPDPDPELERKTFVVADGFEVNLFAADPMLASPIQMNFDAQGRLWVAASEVYPHIKPGQEPTDKILVLEDTDSDGKADKTTVFADGLLIPTGVLPGDGGAYVVNSTELLHLKDTDGDGKADQRRVVLSGFGSEDTHHLLHTLRWGVDGAIYMNQSIYIHSHVETPYGVKRLNGGGIWRFRPDTLKLDILCRGFVNPWGHHQDRWGQSFATDGAYGEGINYVFPGSIFVTAPGEKRRVEGLNPGSPKHCGLEILSGRHLPDEWQGNMITNDFRAHRVCRFVISEDGSGYSSRQEVELIKSNHVAFRPIDVKMGPDGAIYIADWYNPIIQHGEVDFRDPRRDHVHGRIWRVTAKDRPLVKRPKIVGAEIAELLELLKAPEDWVRLWAKQELKTHKPDEVAAAIGAWLKKLDKKNLNFEHHRLEALWACQTVKEGGEFPLHKVHDPVNFLVNDLLGELMTSDDHRVRAANVRASTFWGNQIIPVLIVRAAVTEEKHPRVRLEGVRALANSSSAASAAWATNVLDHPMDRFLDFALWQTIRDLKSHWLPALEKGEIDFGGNVEHLTFALKAVDSPQIVGLLLKRFQSGEVTPAQATTSAELIAGLGNQQELYQLFAYIAKPETKLEPVERAEMLSTIVAATTQRRLAMQGDMTPLFELLSSDDDRLLAETLRAGGAWKVKALRAPLKQAAVGSGSPSAEVRRAALEGLAMFGDEECRNTLLGVSVEDKDADMRSYAIGQLAVVGIEPAADAAVKFLEVIPKPSGAQPLVASIVSLKGGPEALTKALGDKKLKLDVAKFALRAARAAAGDTSALQGALRTAGGLTAEPKKYTPEEIAALVAKVNEQGDPQRGEEIYRRREMQCLNCHSIGGAGGIVGPDLISIGASAQVDYLLESLVDPNAKVKENFHSLIIETDEGKLHSGIPVRQTDELIVLRDQNDKEVAIPVTSIEIKREGRSLMPEGLVEPLTQDELVDLTAFLSKLGKDGPFAVGKERVVRRLRKLVFTPEGHRRLNRTSHDTAASDDAALVWEPAYSQVSGELPLDESLHPFVIHRGHDPVSFVRFEVDVTSPGDVGLQFGETDGLTLWVDGKPTKLSPALSLSLTKRTHVFTLAINRQQRKAPLRVELVDVPDSTARAELVGGK